MSFEFEAGFFCRMLAQARNRPRRVLIVGCGRGAEVEHIARATGAAVTGVDFELDPQWKRPGLDLMRADGRRLPFRDGVFDALYCYHVLEHVPGPERAVAEARRVLAKGGIAFFGTPNKSRLIGYAGGRAKAWDKVRWNLVDWGKRLSGRWANEKGAHAGFSGGELSRMLARSFSRVEAMSLSYYESKYPRLKALWNTSFRLGVGRFLAPSVYFRATDEDGAGRD